MTLDLIGIQPALEALAIAAAPAPNGDTTPGAKAKSVSNSLTSASEPIPSTTRPSGGTGSSSNDKQPFFFPPLWLARRAACLEVLKKEQVKSVVDFGCGEGSLLQLLVKPANHLDDFPSLYPPSPYVQTPSTSPSSTSAFLSHRSRKLDALRSVPRPPPTQNELHLSKVVGVDLRTEAVESAVKVTAPPAVQNGAAEEPAEKWSTERERWESLVVEIFQGGVEVYNDQLDGIEGVVACEVLEHLTPRAFAKFPSTVLGKYSPRIVVVTTPNHEFNPYFVSSSEEEESRNRFPDPTGRTQRVFRDSDHKFEMTQAEFRNWAEQAASDHDYRVSFYGVGSLASYYSPSPVPSPPPSLSAHPALAGTSYPPSDPTTFYATQIAVFKRHYSLEPERSPRSHRTAPLPFFSPTGTFVLGTPGLPDASGGSYGGIGGSQFEFSPVVCASVPHVLVKTHHYPAHPASGNPRSPGEILGEAAKVLEECRRDSMPLRDIWSQGSVRIASGGVVGNVVDAIVDDDSGAWDFKVDQSGVTKGDLACEVVWKAYEDRLVGAVGNEVEVEEEDDYDDDDDEDGQYDDEDGQYDDEDFDDGFGEDQRSHGAAAFVRGSSDEGIDDDNAWEGVVSQDWGARIEK